MSGDDEIPDRVIASALEFAVGIAAAGAKLRPPLPFPVELRPFLKFQKLPAKALRDVRRAVEADGVFLHRLASVAVADLVEPAGMLWLTRPEGWGDQMMVLAAGERHPADAAAELRRADRRREAAEAAAHRALAEVAAMRTQIDRHDDASSTAAGQVAELRRERDLAHVDAAAQRAAARRATERSATASERIEQLTTDLAVAKQLLIHAEQMRDDLLAARADAGRAPGRDSTADRGEVVLGGAASAAEELAAQGQRAEEMGRELRRLARSIGALEPVAQRTPPGASSVPRGIRPKNTSRRPIAVPGGLYGTSIAAVEHVVRHPGAVVLVDGYNVAKLRWPQISLEMQRERTVDLCEDLARRWGTEITVVFDGASLPGASAAGRRLVRVTYSPAGVTADDVLRAEVERLPDRVPVVVVTNDRAIVADTRALGANTVSSEQFIELAAH